MRVLYPAEDDIPSLSEEQLSLKIARHSPCSLCPCSGLRPPAGVEVSPDDSLLSDQMELAYLSECQCGHDVPLHRADAAILGRPEYQRRGRVAVRIDELLQVRGGALYLMSTSDRMNGESRCGSMSRGYLRISQADPRFPVALYIGCWKARRLQFHGRRYHVATPPDVVTSNLLPGRYLQC